VDGYHRVDRAVKYAMIFISLNFLIFLLWERSLGRGAIHPVQYAVIGLAEALFYLVLLALFEHVGFGAAYLAASALDVAMVGGYSLAVTGRRLGAAVVSLLLTMLHAVLYVILSLEDYALLAGTALLVIALAAVMIATRKLGAPAPGEEGLSGPGGPPPCGAPPKSAEAPDEPASPKAPLMEPQGAL
jgi:inner membrane protein